MTQAPLPDLFMYAAVYVDPDDRVTDIKDAAQWWVDTILIPELESIQTEGFAIWSRKPPQERLEGFFQATIAEEIEMVTDPAYMKLVAIGQAPPPRSPFWFAMAQLPGEIFMDWTRDFQNLLAADFRRLEAAI